MCLRWTGGMERNESSSQKLVMNITGTNGKSFDVTVCTVKNLDLPSQSLDYKKLSERYSYLKHLPVQCYKSAVPEILIGLNNCHLITATKIKEGERLDPVAISTKLGWMVYGMTTNISPSKHFAFHICE